MLNHPTLDKLKTLKLYGMIQGLLNQVQHPAIDQMSFEERLGLLVDREMTDRLDRRLKNRLLQAKLKQNACLEDVNYQADRGDSIKRYYRAYRIASGLKNILMS